MRAASLTSMKANFEVVVVALETISTSGTDESAATASGLIKRIESFDYIFASFSYCLLCIMYCQDQVLQLSAVSRRCEG